MEGTPVRSRLPLSETLIHLNAADDLTTLRSNLVSLLSEQLRQSEILVTLSDPATTQTVTEGLQSWLKSHLERNPGLIQKLSTGEHVSIAQAELASPHPVGAARSNVLLLPIMTAAGLSGLIGVISPTENNPPSQEEIDSVRWVAQFAGPLVSRLLEFHRLHTESTTLAGIVKMRDHFQSNVAHELRTPLAAIRGYSRMILDGRAGEINSKQQEYLTVVTDNTNRLIHLVNWMSHVLDGSAESLRLNTFDLSDVWSECLVRHETFLQEKSVTVQQEIPAEPFILLGDPEKLADVLDTLLRGAVKFADAGSVVAIQFTHGREKDVAVKISSTGDGIPREILNRILVRPLNSDSIPSVDGGDELDLSGVHDVIGMHGGRMFVNSTPGEGSTFIITLPAVMKDGEEKLSHEQTVNSGRRRR